MNEENYSAQVGSHGNVAPEINIKIVRFKKYSIYFKYFFNGFSLVQHKISL